MKRQIRFVAAPHIQLENEALSYPRTLEELADEVYQVEACDLADLLETLVEMLREGCILPVLTGVQELD